HHFLLRKLRAPNPKYWWSKTATPLLGAWLFVPAGMRARLLADCRCACGNCEKPRSAASPGAQGPAPAVTLEEIEQGAQSAAALRLQLGIALDHQPRIVARRLQQLGMGGEVGQFHIRQTALAGAQKLAGAAQAQVLLGDAKAILGLAHDGEP